MFMSLPHTCYRGLFSGTCGLVSGVGLANERLPTSGNAEMQVWRAYMRIQPGESFR